MLGAKDQQGNLFFLGQSNKSEYKEMKKQAWYCPACEEEVILKSGAIKQAHFAHRSLENCSVFSENESEEHLSGKLFFAEWCNYYQIPYEIEAYLPELNQRPDVLIDGQYAIEFQCSSLSIERFCERTQMYQEHGYHVIWVVGEKFHLKESVSELQRYFFDFHHSLGFCLWQLSIARAELSCQIKIEKEIESKKINCFSKTWLPDKHSPQEWLDFMANHLFFPMRQYDSGKQATTIYQQLAKNLHFQNPRMMTLQQKLYESGRHLLLLDPIYYSFLPGMWFIDGEIIEWLLFWWENIGNGNSLQEISAHFQLAIDEGEIHIYSLVQVTVDECLDYFLNEWHRLLEQHHYIERIDNCIQILKFPAEQQSNQQTQENIQKLWGEQRQISASFLRSVVR